MEETKNYLVQEERSERGWKEANDDVEESVRVNAVIYLFIFL